MDALRALRDGLLENREDWEAACAAFAWPVLDEFNWALDWFDPFARGNDAVGLLVVEADGSSVSLTFDELVTRSDQVATWLRAQGVARGDRIVLMLGNQVELWETMLAAMKLGAVVIPATTLLAEIRPARPHRPRAGAPRRRALRRRGEVRRRARRLHADRGRRSGARVAGLLARLRGAGGVRPRRADPRRRHAAAVFHLRHDRAAEARRAHARVLSRRPSLDDVLDRPAAGRRPPQPELARVGQARVVELLRAVAGRGDGRDLQLRALRRGRAAERDRHARRDDVLRAADRLADADPGRPGLGEDVAARGRGRRRAAEPGGHRAGREGLGPDAARRLRPDRDHAADRQPARAAL